MNIALVVGHSKESQGAVNMSLGMTEFQYNEELVHTVACNLLNTQHKALVFYRNKYRDLPFEINSKSPDLILSFHCNAYNTRVSGTEALYYHTSSMGKEIATELSHKLSQLLEIPNRGAKPKTAEDRGGYLLKYTVAPCVILEPFFIDNTSDLQKGLDKLPDIADEIADFLHKL